MTIQKGYADTAAGQVHYRRVNGPGAPIVLLHRTPVSSASFERMLALFAGRRGAVALDTPGFGQSFRPSEMPATRDYAAWMLAALDALDIEQFHLCAHHTGTHFAAEMALLAPERAYSLLLSGVLHAGPTVRQSIRDDVGSADPIDPEGRYLTNAWRLMRKLFPDYDAELIHAETLGALGAIEGRDQAFGAILDQDFPEVLSRVTCPVAIVQASDDPLAPMLYRVRGRHPAIPIRRIGNAGLAAPERQASSYADVALAFAANHEATHEDLPMTDRRFELVRTPAGYDLRETRAATPQPGLGEVLVRVRAVSLNRRDISIRDLSYPVFEADHFTPLSDGAGEIVAVGEGVTDLAVGDRVVATFFQNWPDGTITMPGILSALGAGGPGMLADHVLLAETGVTRIPDDWSFEEAACIPCSAVTAWSALMTLG